MSYKLLNISDENAWNEQIKNLPPDQQDIYFTPEYYKVQLRKGEGDPFCFVYEEEGKLALYSFLKNSINKLDLLDLDGEYFDIQSAYGFHGVITNTYDPDFIKNFYKAFQEFSAEENIVAEFVRFHPLLNNAEFSKDHLEILRQREVIKLNLNLGYDKIWDDMYSSVNRNMIRKAVKNGLSYKVLHGKTLSVQDFADLYERTMKEIDAKEYYYFGNSYFSDFKDLLEDNVHIIEVYHGDKLIQGIFLFIYGSFAHYHLSARDSEFKSLASNNFALDVGIKVAIENNCDYFHFGGGNSDSVEDPLYKFKANFSKERAIFSIGKKVHNQEIYTKLIKGWEEKNPEKSKTIGNILLKYRV
ncbi:MAG: GNAT family N-acetyltransferase [Bacteroidetes bacterium]|nr:GNAT family N-acetyltransferase [Bacteroidota bacterium]